MRIAQYGFSVERCWAMLIEFFFILFSVGYVFAIIKKRDNWIKEVSRINIIMGAIVLGAMVFVNTPVLDFKKITLASQLQRFHSGKISADTLDINYIYLNLGRPGYFALKSLEQEYAIKNPDFAEKISSVWNHQNNYPMPSSVQEFSNVLVRFPSDAPVPIELENAIYESIVVKKLYGESFIKYYLIRKDLNEDGKDDYILTLKKEWNAISVLWVYENQDWKSMKMNNNYWGGNNIEENIKSNKIEIIKHEWNKLKIGDTVFTVEENE